MCVRERDWGSEEGRGEEVGRKWGREVRVFFCVFERFFFFCSFVCEETFDVAK